MAIDHVNLGRVDLNLLVTFDALMTGRSVTRAAARVGIGQSAMSHNLARLRTLFRDELLVRGAEGMRPTPRAMALVEPVRAALVQVEGLVRRDETFNPMSANRVFRVGLPDSIEVLIGPALLEHVREVAPHVRLRLHATDRLDLLAELDADRLDLGIGVRAYPEGQTHHRQQILGTDSYLCMFNARLVGFTPPISLEDYLLLPHVLASLRQDERGLVDEVLAKRGLKRTLALVTPHFAALPFMVARSAVVTTIHAKLATLFASTFGLALSPVPIDLPRITVSMLWHTSYDRDPAQKWLRQEVARVMSHASRA